MKFVGFGRGQDHLLAVFLALRRRALALELDQAVQPEPDAREVVGASGRYGGPDPALPPSAAFRRGQDVGQRDGDHRRELRSGRCVGDGGGFLPGVGRSVGRTGFRRRPGQQRQGDSEDEAGETGNVHGGDGEEAIKRERCNGVKRGSDPSAIPRSNARSVDRNGLSFRGVPDGDLGERYTRISGHCRDRHPVQPPRYAHFELQVSAITTWVSSGSDGFKRSQIHRATCSLVGFSSPGISLR